MVVVSCRELPENGGNGSGRGVASCQKMAEMGGGKELPRAARDKQKLGELKGYLELQLAARNWGEGRSCRELLEKWWDGRV